ncbi:hypothetical protein ACSDR0_49855 [Streptosporangium sp. G11]
MGIDVWAFESAVRIQPDVAYRLDQAVRIAARLDDGFIGSNQVIVFPSIS